MKRTVKRARPRHRRDGALARYEAGKAEIGRTARSAQEYERRLRELAAREGV